MLWCPGFGWVFPHHLFSPEIRKSVDSAPRFPQSALATTNSDRTMLCVASLWPTSLWHQGARLARVSAPRAPPARLELGWDEVEYDNHDDEMDAVHGTWTADELGGDMLLGAASSSSDDGVDELQSLVGEWQEQQAIADESGGPATAAQQVAQAQRPNPSPS